MGPTNSVGDSSQKARDLLLSDFEIHPILSFQEKHTGTLDSLDFCVTFNTSKTCSTRMVHPIVTPCTSPISYKVVGFRPLLIKLSLFCIEMIQGLAWHAAALASFARARCGPSGRRAGAAAAAVLVVVGRAMPTATVATEAAWLSRMVEEGPKDVEMTNHPI